ncbi:MAG: YidE/YbjL duplication [Clostridia bacterium]|nr:YidE/YbjL duplication [Clostridia bacterium]
MVYISSVIAKMITPLFCVFVIAALGYLLGGIKIKGISLGTAGVLVVALLFGVLANKVPSFTLGGTEIALFSDSIKANYSFVSSLGTALFVTAVGLIAGPKFFRNFNKKAIGYIFNGLIVIASGALITMIIIKFGNVDKNMAVGLMTGALTSTPGLSAAKEVAGEVGESAVTSGYGIAYLFGVLGVVFFVQLMPRFEKVDMAKEREKIVSAGEVNIKKVNGKLVRIDTFDIFPFVMTVALGMVLGAFKIPGINFSLGTSGGTLIMGLIVGHFGRVGKISLSVNKNTLNFMRELGLCLFLIGAGVPGGVNFVTHFKTIYFFYGALITLIPMFIGYFVSKFVFKFGILNNLASITGGMTSTPALGTLISVAETDEISSSYAATYPIALVCVVLAAKIIIMAI